MKAIEQVQVRKIYAIGHALGLVCSGTKEDELHALVAGVTGKNSVKDLTYKEAGQVIARLEGLQGKVSSGAARRQPREYAERPGGITAAQQRKVWALMYELRKYDEAENNVPLGDRLCRIIRKELKINAIAKEPFAWLDFAQGSRLIEILKGYTANAAKKGGDKSGSAGQRTG